MKECRKIKKNNKKMKIVMDDENMYSIHTPVSPLLLLYIYDCTYIKTELYCS